VALASQSLSPLTFVILISLLLIKYTVSLPMGSWTTQPSFACLYSKEAILWKSSMTTSFHVFLTLVLLVWFAVPLVVTALPFSIQCL
jgi:hypothetical protein